MESVMNVFENKEKKSLEEAKRLVCQIFYSDITTLGIEGINSTFYPQLAGWAKTKMPKKNALEIIQEVFLSFDPYSQKRESKIFEKYLYQLGSK